ncbi:MAG: hypothetical protein E7223_02120 [Clostridiales bacterium]|nr:hypothetical protein [Clostridiales bacterium]MBQ3107907.1 hypothetical protein [Bacillota bacterium]
MKGKTKTAIALLMVLSLFLFAGCGRRDETDDPNRNDDPYYEDEKDSGDKGNDMGEDLKEDLKDMGDDLKDGMEDGMERMRRSLDDAERDLRDSGTVLPGSGGSGAAPGI